MLALVSGRQSPLLSTLLSAIAVSLTVELYSRQREGVHTEMMSVEDLPGTIKTLEEKGVQLIGADRPGGQVFIHSCSAPGCSSSWARTTRSAAADGATAPLPPA